MKKAAKIFVKFSEGEYENNPFCGSAYVAKTPEMTAENSGEYLAKGAVIQALLQLDPQARKPMNRADANGFSKKMANERLKMLHDIINQIASM